MHAVSAVGSTKLLPRFVGPFTVISAHGNAYTLNLASIMATHPTFYVGMLKVYLDPSGPPDTNATSDPSVDAGRPDSGSDSDAPVVVPATPIVQDTQRRPQHKKTALKDTQAVVQSTQDVAPNS